MSSRGDAGCLTNLGGGLIVLALCSVAGKWLYDLVGKWLFWAIVVLVTFALLRAIWRSSKK